MIEVVFRLLQKPRAPIDISSISPSIIAGYTINEVGSIAIRYGNRVLKAKDLFEIDCYNHIPGDPKLIKIIFTGMGTEKLWFVGKDMEEGIIEVHGNVGPFAGYEMKGGCLIVRGCARECLGVSMENGIIEVHGEAGSFVGAKPFFSNSTGMRGGRIVIRGNAQHYVGFCMRGGYVEIFGDVGDFLGTKMSGGTIVVHGSSGAYPGLEMINGLIIICKGVEDMDTGFEALEIQDYIQKPYSHSFRAFVGDRLANGFGLILLLNGCK
ncbi:MAG: formylmethanofuran dehydrogenase subunit C [Ignisphaera sp.]|uniref:formylmethanofuran dehydrogenase n=1 Tax=Ignisphaera aggregans TaxID=334771 RepID=A0A7J3MWR2_9CREN